MNVIAIKWMADYGHFSHPGTTYTSLTYPLPPKTTIAGFLGAIIGEADYWELCDQFRYAIRLDTPYRTKKFSFNGVQKVLDSAIVKVDKKYIAQNNSTHKQFQRELICSPEYTLFLDFSSMKEEIKEKLTDYLKEHKAACTPYMGINLCLCDFEWLGEYEAILVEDNETEVSTIAYKEDFIFSIDTGQRLTTAIMASTVDAHRYFGKFSEYIISLNPQCTIHTKNDGSIYAIEQQNYCFF